MHKALLHNGAQFCKVTKIHVFSQSKTGNSSRARILYVKSTFCTAKTACSIANPHASKRTHQAKEKRKTVLHISVYRDYYYLRDTS